MGQWVRHPWTIRACQLALGMLFAWAALGKLADLPAFAEDVHNFRLVPIALENLVTIVLPWIELVAALALVLGLQAREGAAVNTLLLVVFTIAVVAAWARGLDFECGCFGTADGSRVGLIKVSQNLGLLLIGVGACLRER